MGDSCCPGVCCASRGLLLMALLKSKDFCQRLLYIFLCVLLTSDNGRITKTCNIINKVIYNIFLGLPVRFSSFGWEIYEKTKHTHRIPHPAQGAPCR